MLKTDYKNDVLDTSVNDNRKYEMTNNSDGTISLTDVTVYSQEGSLLGANDINDTNTEVNKLNQNLTAQDGLEFNFQVDNDGNYGILNKEGEFMSFAKENIDCYYSQTNTRPANFVLPTDCKVGYVYGWNAGWNATNPQFTVTANKGTLTKLFSRSEGSGQGSANGFGVYKLENAPSGTTLNFTYGTGGSANLGGFTVVISK